MTTHQLPPQRLIPTLHEEPRARLVEDRSTIIAHRPEAVLSQHRPRRFAHLLDDLLLVLGELLENLHQVGSHLTPSFCSDTYSTVSHDRDSAPSDCRCTWSSSAHELRAAARAA